MRQMTKSIWQRIKLEKRIISRILGYIETFEESIGVECAWCFLGTVCATISIDLRVCGQANSVTPAPVPENESRNRQLSKVARY